MSIVDDLAPYMTLIRFTESDDIERAYFEATYDNIGQGDPHGGPGLDAYVGSNLVNGFFRRGSFDEDFEIVKIDALFQPVANGELWRGVVRDHWGRLLGASEWTAISGLDEHEFELTESLSLLAETEYAFGVEPQDPAQQATVYVNDIPNDLAPGGGFKTDHGKLLSKVYPPPSTWDNQVLAVGEGTDARIRRIDPESGTSTLWTVTGTGNAIVYGALPTGEVVGSIGAEFMILDPADGTELFGETLNSTPLSGSYSKPGAMARDGSALYILLDNGQLAIVDLGATPGITYSNDFHSGYTHNMLAITPDGTKLVLAHYSGGTVDAYAVGDLNTPLWSHAPEFASSIYAMNVNDVAVYYSGSSSSEYMVRLNIETGGRTDRRSMGGYAHHLVVDDTDTFVYVTSVAGSQWSWGVGRVPINDDGTLAPDETWVTDQFDASWRAYRMTLDGESLYVSTSDDRHAIVRIDLDTGAVDWRSPSWSSASNTNNPSGYIGVAVIAHFDAFEEVDDGSIAVRLYRQVAWDAVNNRGYLVGHREFPTYVYIRPTQEAVRALVTELGIVQGQARQVTLQGRSDGAGTWRELRLARRSRLVAQDYFQLRVVIGPADIYEDWTEVAGSPERATATDFLSFPSRNPMGWSSTVFNDGANWTTGSGEWGRYFSMTSANYDTESYGLMFLGRDQNGDVEFIRNHYSSVGGHFYFRGPSKTSPQDAWRIEFDTDTIKLVGPGFSSTSIGSGDTTTSNYYHWRVIWRGSRLVILRNGKLFYEFNELTHDDPSRQWFGFNTYGTSIARVYSVRGHGMANGPEGGADIVEVDALSAFHERAA